MSSESSTSATPLATAIPVTERYRRACRTLRVPLAPERLLGASYSLAAVSWLCGLAILGFVSGPVGTVGGAGCLVGAVGVALLGRYGAPLAARLRRIRALGAGPALVATLALGMRLWPTTERAGAFAVRAGDGRLVERLAAHRRRARGTPRDGHGTFVDEWGDRFPALERAFESVERAALAPARERDAVLRRARRQILDGTRDEMAQFAAALRAPATGLYAFGVLLPLAMVSLLPAVTAAGVPVTTPMLVVFYGLVLPAGLIVASAWLLGRRPVAFPSATVPRNHPDVPSGPERALASGGLVAVGGWTIAAVVAPGWAPAVAALGGGTGTALVVYYRPVSAVRDHVSAVESGLPDLLDAVGRRVDRGESVEAALEEAVGVTGDPLSTLLAATLDRQRRLDTDIETAFRGEYGTLSTVPSPRLERTATLLAAAADIGPPAGETLAAMGDHLAELDAVERETRRDLAQITGTLSNTGALFGPLIGGATVALSATMGTGGPIESPPSAALGPLVGWYCLVLAVVLTTLSTGLEQGLDRARVGYRVGLALCAATATYLTAAVATGLVL
ncbi:type II secretion system protein [Haloarcula marina]|uniref:type II secretion system protein n=1 Tax=Haloarcula marina TaxID=2961574 RepID=UPI0020B6B0DF|nr:type II secretion system protein [Halomicroarcula marina]